MERFPHDDPREWLNRARSNLTRAATTGGIPGTYLEDACFDAQQAAEKAIKAVLVQMGMEFPFIHNLAQLLLLVEQAGQPVVEHLRAAETLTVYAAVTRYPGIVPLVVREDYDRAVDIATTVVRWAEGIIGYPLPGTP